MRNESVNISRRDFFKDLGMIGGGGVLLSAFPWLQSCSADDKVKLVKEKVRIGMIGTGSRGQYHLNNLKEVKTRFDRVFFFLCPFQGQKL